MAQKIKKDQPKTWSYRAGKKGKNRVRVYEEWPAPARSAGAGI
jgi:hypothetical protein